MADKEKFRRVEEMVELAGELRDSIEKNDLNSFGEILHRGWQLKRGVASGISNDVVESNYQLAREAGAEGGKLLGAGAGGFLLLSCHSEKQKQVRAALKNLREMSIALISEGSQILHNDGRNDPILAVGQSA
jgi:D-glycero-alpha-D-manno-heptose-7-phosphate kinase